MSNPTMKETKMADGDGRTIKIGDRTIIFNGGERLPGSDAPESFEQAHALADRWNEDPAVPGVSWRWDCGFKLDYDGGLVRVSSRFYPPAKQYGEGWDGNVSVFINQRTQPSSDGAMVEVADGGPRARFEIKADTLEELRYMAETLVAEISRRVAWAAHEEVLAGDLADFYDDLVDGKGEG